MESARARELTTRLVAGGLLLSAAALLVGLGLGFTRGIQGGHVVPFPELPASLARGDAIAWLSIGLTLLILTPALRLAGIIVIFVAEDDRREIPAAALLLVLIVAELALNALG